MSPAVYTDWLSAECRRLVLCCSFPENCGKFEQDVLNGATRRPSAGSLEGRQEESEIQICYFTMTESRHIVSSLHRNFFGEGSTNSIEDREQRVQRSGGGSPLVSGSTQFANE
jgi:hypothetical protein